MKLAITASTPHLDAWISPRFGRSPYIVFVDTETMEAEVVRNPDAEKTRGAGTGTAQLVAEKGAEVVITGNVGPNAMKVLADAGLKVIAGITGRVREAVEKFKAGTLPLQY